MDVNRFVLMMVLEVVSELTRRLGHIDLFEKCDECRREVDDTKSPGPEGG